MKNYRIVSRERGGYIVQERVKWFWWITCKENLSGSFISSETDIVFGEVMQARIYIANEKLKVVGTLTKERYIEYV